MTSATDWAAGLGLYHQSKSYASISNLVEVPGSPDAAAYAKLICVSSFSSTSRIFSTKSTLASQQRQ